MDPKKLSCLLVEDGVFGDGPFGPSVLLKNESILAGEGLDDLEFGCPPPIIPDVHGFRFSEFLLPLTGVFRWFLATGDNLLGDNLRKPK